MTDLYIIHLVYASERTNEREREKRICGACLDAVFRVSHGGGTRHARGSNVTEGGCVLGATARRRGGGGSGCSSHGGNAHAHVEPNGALHCAPPIGTSHRSPINRARDKSPRLCFCRRDDGCTTPPSPSSRFWLPRSLAPGAFFRGVART